jgi:hypothetical protein
LTQSTKQETRNNKTTKILDQTSNQQGGVMNGETLQLTKFAPGEKIEAPPGASFMARVKAS